MPKLVSALQLCSVFVLCSSSAYAGDAIMYDAARQVWLLQTRHATYAFGANERGELQSLYWGASVTRIEDFPALHSLPEHASFDLPGTTTPQEYPGWGAGLYTEPALKATFESGNRDLVLHYAGQETNVDTLTIQLKDVALDFKVRLTYRVYPDADIIERSATIENGTKEAVVLESAQSAAWTLPAAPDYRLRHLTGAWAREWQLQTEPIHPGAFVLESRRGSTGHQNAPWFALSREETTEENGPVWFGALGWSGSWRISVEQTSTTGLVRVTGGFNPFDFGYRLAPGESLSTPPFFAGYTGAGFGSASRILHEFARNHILPHGPDRRIRPVLYNSWEATTFHVNEAGQIALAERAAKLGVERFVIDDGWFGARNNDRAGLGDWWVNPQKFPNGLKPVIDKVHSLGMDFGIWVEPEMVNPNSDLYRKHPDWVINFAGRPRTEGRNQLVLNLAREDVKEYVFGFLDKLVSENDIAFLKWDYNRNWSEPGWPEAAVQDQKKIWVRYVLNLYDILDRLRAKHPRLEIESCSGGGGRVDFGILRRTEEAWTSDNTDALDRLCIQYGFTQAYPPDVMMAWVTDPPPNRATPLKFRFLVAMNGSLGIGGNLNRWSDADMALAAKLAAFYKGIRETVQKGRLYRLSAPDAAGKAVNEYVSQDGNQAVVFAFLPSQHLGEAYPAVLLRGLDEKALYRLLPLDHEKLATRAETVSGAWLMHAGLSLRMGGNYDSTAVVLEKVR